MLRFMSLSGYYSSLVFSIIENIKIIVSLLKLRFAIMADRILVMYLAYQGYFRLQLLIW